MTQSQTLKPKRNSRLRLIVLLMALTAMAAIYVPVRTGRANDRLKQSMWNSDDAGVQAALDNGADPDLPIGRIIPPDPYHNLIDFVRVLVHRSVHPRTANVKTALMYAANNSNAEVVAALLKHGANVNRRLDNGYTALLYAAPRASPEILTALLNRGADLHVQTRDGATPLLLAARTGQTQNARLLLAKGVDIHETDHQSQTALSLATENRHEEMIRLLLSQGADERDLKAARSSPINPVASSAAARGSFSVITPGASGPTNGPGALVPAHASRPPPPAPPPPTLSPVAFAAKYGSLSLLQFVWPRHAPGVSPQAGWDIVCKAVVSGQAGPVRFLLDQKLPVNLPSAPPPTGSESVHFPSGSEPNKVYTPLHYAAALRTSEIAGMLIAHGADVDAEDAFGTTPLLAAIGGQHLETVRLLLAHGANVPTAERRTGRTALMHSDLNAEIARLLLDHGLEVDARDHAGRTALMQCYNPPVAALLIARGADVNIRDKQGDTPLLTAVRAGETKCVTLLLKHGADANVSNSQGQTPLSVATAMRSGSAPYIIRVLTAAGAKR